MDKVKQGDKERVLLWLRKYAFGFREARVRSNILPNMGSMTDRYWRLCIAELKKEGLVASTSSLGYWAVPENTRDVQELEAALESCEELKSKALDMLTGLNTQITALTRRLEAETKQFEFAITRGK